MNKFEKLRFLEKKIERLKKCLDEFEKFPHVVLSDTRFADVSFWDQTEKTKRRKPIPAIKDLPPGAAEIIKEWIEVELTEAETEFQGYFTDD